jgi:hypothetical protein
MFIILTLHQNTVLLNSHYRDQMKDSLIADVTICRIKKHLCKSNANINMGNKSGMPTITLKVNNFIRQYFYSLDP